MVQFRRLDPLANAGPYQRLIKSPVKSFSLSEAQYNRLQEQRPQFLVREGDGAVLAFPYRDYIEIHYAFPDVESFRDHFTELFNRCLGAVTREDGPRGVVLSFRDRPNRSLANTLFWSLALEEGEQWVEMNWIAVPEQPEPGDVISEGTRVREAGEADRSAIARLDGEAAGQPPLSDSAVDGLFENSRSLHVVEGASGPLAYVALRGEPGGWGVIDHVALKPDAAAALREPLMRWTVAWLRNHGGRRIRRRVYTRDAEDLALLRNLGFTAGETGVDYTRPTDASEVRSKIDERQAHGTLIKFGDWR
jgi:hypothetical protein